MFTVGLDISALDGEFKAHAARGIGRYVYELKSYFERSRIEDLKVAPFDHRSFAALPLLDKALGKFPLGRVTLRQQVLYPVRMGLGRKLGFNVLHFPAQMDAPSWSPMPYMVTVLDLIPLVCRDIYRPDRPGWRFALARFFERRAIQNAALVLAISQNTANDVNRLMGVPFEKILVAPLGVDQKFFEVIWGQDDRALREKYRIPAGREIILYVGGIDQRKNCAGMLDVLTRVLRSCRERGKPLPLFLMAGKIADDKQFPRLQTLIKERELQDYVIMPGFVPDGDLIKLYGISRVFCFLSLYEGFGLTPLEAMAAGLPVVSSNTSSMPEVLEDAVIMAAPDQIDKAAESICNVLENNHLAMTLSLRGRKQAKKFSWTRTGDLTLKAYRKYAAQVS